MRQRRTTVQPGRWRCRLCTAHGYDIDPSAAFYAHYWNTHYAAPKKSHPPRV